MNNERSTNNQLPLRLAFILLVQILAAQVNAQVLFEMPAGVSSRLSSFENPNGVKGAGGKTNKTAKGNAFEMVAPGTTKTLLDITGQGTIQRIWLTIDQNPV